MRGLRRTLGIVGAALVVATAALGSIAPVEAAWQERELATASVTAGTVLPPTRSGPCRVNAQSTSVTYTWTHASGGLERTSYGVEVVRAGSDMVVGSTTLAPTATTISATPGSMLARNTTYELRVTAVSGTWESTVVVGTFTTTSRSASTVASCTW